jgi:hypothetical protein
MSSNFEKVAPKPKKVGNHHCLRKITILRLLKNRQKNVKYQVLQKTITMMSKQKSRKINAIHMYTCFSHFVHGSHLVVGNNFQAEEATEEREECRSLKNTFLPDGAFLFRIHLASDGTAVSIGKVFRVRHCSDDPEFTRRVSAIAYR